MTIETKDRTFDSAGQYFDYMSEVLGHPPYHHHFSPEVVMSDGLRLHIDVYEHSKKSPTIIFIPGTAIYAMCYAEILYKLGKSGYNVIGLDPRGHGQSEGIRGDYTIHELMTDVGHVINYAIDRFGKRVSLMGSSQGGILALYMAARDERLDCVVCQNIADLSGEEAVKLTRHPTLFKYMKMMIGGRAGELIPNAMIPMSAYIDMQSIPISYFGNIQNFIENDPLAVKDISVRALQSLGGTAMDRPISRIKVPVMVFQGSDDTIFPVPYTEGLFKKLTCQKRMIVFPKMQHSLMSENVDVILPDILAWLGEIYHK